MSTIRSHKKYAYHGVKRISARLKKILNISNVKLTLIGAHSINNGR